MGKSGGCVKALPVLSVVRHLGIEEPRLVPRARIDAARLCEHRTGTRRACKQQGAKKGEQDEHHLRHEQLPCRARMSAAPGVSRIAVRNWLAASVKRHLRGLVCCRPRTI
jgi:hypothetical protein